MKEQLILIGSRLKKNKLLTVSITVVILFAIVFRLIFLFQMTSMPFGGEKVSGGDSVYYLNWESRLNTAHDGQQKAFFMSPLYPYFLHVLFRLVGEKLLFVRLIQHLLGVLVICGIGWLVFLLDGRKNALLAIFLAAFTGVTIFYEGMILMTSLLLFLNTLFLVLLFTYGWRNIFWGAFLPGIILGISAIGRGNALAFVPIVFLFYSLAMKEKDLWWIAGRGLVFVFAVFLALAPVSLHNYYSEGTLTLTTTNLGLNFFIGNNSNSKGTYDIPDELRFIPGEFDEDIEGKIYAEKVLGKKLTSQEVSHYWFQRGLTFWKRQPLEAMTNFIRKVRLFWSGYEIPQIENYYLYKRDFTPVLSFAFVSFLLLSPLALTGLFFSYRHKMYLITSLFVVTYCGTIAIFFITARYRLPIFCCFILLANHALKVLWLYISKKHIKGTIIWVIVFIIALFIAGSQPFDLRYTHAQQYNQLGFLLFKNDEYTQAAAMYQKSLEEDPAYYTAERNLGDVLMKLGDYDGAIQHYLKALQINPKDAVAHFNLGFLFHLLGRNEEAKSEYEKAISFDSTFSMAYNNLALILEGEGKIDEALKLYEKALTADIQNHRAYNNLGQLVYRLGMVKEAGKLFQRAYQEKKDEAKYLYNWATTLADSGEKEKAGKYFEFLFHEAGNDATMSKKCLYKLLELHEDAADSEKLTKWLEQFLDNHPDDVEVRDILLEINERNSEAVDKE